MVDHIVDASAPRGRVEIRSGVGRRRRWSNADKGRIVAESFAPGAVVSDVARRHEISPQHLFAWRKAARRGQLALPADEAAVFVPVMMAAQKPVATTPSITIETAGIVVRAECGVDVGWLAAVLRVVKGLSWSCRRARCASWWRRGRLTFARVWMASPRWCARAWAAILIAACSTGSGPSEPLA